MLLTHRREPLRTGIVGEIGKVFRKKRCGLQKGVIVAQIKRIIWGGKKKKKKFGGVVDMEKGGEGWPKIPGECREWGEGWEFCQLREPRVRKTTKHPKSLESSKTKRGKNAKNPVVARHLQLLGKGKKKNSWKNSSGAEEEGNDQK